MAKVRILDNVFQVKSTLKLKEIDKAENYKPNALKLFNEDKEEIFRISTGDPSLSKYGVCFSEVDQEGYVYISATCSSEMTKEDFAEEFAPVIVKLEMVEKHVEEVLNEIRTLEEKVIENITEV